MAAALGLGLEELGAAGHVVQYPHLPHHPPALLLVHTGLDPLIDRIDRSLDALPHGRQFLLGQLAVLLIQWDGHFPLDRQIQELVAVVTDAVEVVKSAHIALPAVRRARPTSGHGHFPRIARGMVARQEHVSPSVTGPASRNGKRARAG